ncbi:MAG TPA: hypothetical protein VFT50_07330 [Baekduia sp.]|nr:hypothetical protein [Baekduia sp.]
MPGSETAAAPRAEAGEPYAEEGSGWLMFAGIMLAIMGTMNVVYGIAAIDSANFYVANARYVFSDLNTWGWIMTGIGAIQFCAAFAIFANVTWGRWIGIISAGGNAIFQLLFLPSYPFLSLALFAVDILIVYGLVAHGGRRAQLA